MRKPCIQKRKEKPVRGFLDSLFDWFWFRPLFPPRCLWQGIRSTPSVVPRVTRRLVAQGAVTARDRSDHKSQMFPARI
jgi:hypothetical protein